MMNNAIAPDGQGTSQSSYVRALKSTPWKVFGGLLAFQVLGIVISAILLGAGYGIVDPELTGFSYAVNDGDIAARDAAWYAMSEDEENTYLKYKLPTQSLRSVEIDPFQIIYKSDTNCLTPRNLQAMQALEDELVGQADYTSNLCQKLADGSCRKPRSILRFFDGTLLDMGFNVTSGGDFVFAADPSFERISEIIGTAWEADGSSALTSLSSRSPQFNIRSLLQYNIGADYNPVDKSTAFCRSLVYSGYPLSGYQNIRDREDEQRDIIAGRQESILGGYVSTRDAVGTDMKAFYNSDPIAAEARSEQQEIDLLWMLGSYLVVAAFILIWTKSPFVTFFLLLAIFSNYVWANMLYRIICNFQYYGFPQIFAGFVATTLCLVHFFYMAEAYLRAGEKEVALDSIISENIKPVVISGLMVACIFFLACLAPILVVRSFALYCGLIALVNTANSVLFIPALLYTWEQGKKPGCCFASYHSFKVQDQFANWFCDKVLENKPIRWLFLALFAVMLIVFLIIPIVGLRIDRKPPAEWRTPTNQGDWYDYQQSRFNPSDYDNNARVYVVWGLGELDRSGCHETNFDCYGEPIYNRSMDLSASTVQSRLNDFCDSLKALDATTVSNLAIRRSDYIAGEPLEISCYTNAMEASYGKDTFDFSEMVATKNANPTEYPNPIYSAISLTGTYYRNYEFGVMNWFTNTMSAFPSSDFQEYVGMFGGVADATATVDDSSALTFAGNYGDHMTYVAFKANLTLVAHDVSGSEGIPVRKAWDNFLKEKMVDMPAPLQSVFQTTPETRTWAWLETQDNLALSIFGSLGAGLLLLFIGGTIVLNNWILSFYVVFTQVGVIIMLIGLTEMVNWDLGLLEALHFVFVLALSASYVLNIAFEYARNSEPNHSMKVRETIRRSVPSAAAAGIAMAASSLLLFATKLNYIFTFAVYFFAMTGFSLLYSVILFSIFLIIIGPTGTKGTLSSYMSQRRVSDQDAV